MDVVLMWGWFKEAKFRVTCSTGKSGGDEMVWILGRLGGLSPANWLSYVIFARMIV